MWMNSKRRSKPRWPDSLRRPRAKTTKIALILFESSTLLPHLTSQRRLLEQPRAESVIALDHRSVDRE
jgi:hypothetical protein